MKQPITVDFETEAIQSRPNYPPMPVGVAIKYPGRPGKYLHWGHPDDGLGNDRDVRAQDELRDIWRGDSDILFHNSKFDLDVAQVHFGLKPPPWDRIHDAMFSLFLDDPHSMSLGLKESAEKYLKIPPDERDAVKKWLIGHKVVATNASKDEIKGATCKAPASVVGPYAVGDVERTFALHQLLYPKLDEGMRRAYDRERRLMPYLMANESEGLRVDCDQLAEDLVLYEAALEYVEQWLRKKLQAPNLNFDEAREVGDALHKTGIVTDWVWTKGGKNRPPQRSVAKDNLGPERFHDPSVASGLGYRTRLHTVLANSMRPWLDQAGSAGGIIYTSWNQVRRHDEGEKKSKGARTGRVTASRFLNTSKNWLNKGDGYLHPDLLELPPLPLVRKYVFPDPKTRWNHRDTKQQEFKIAAHYAGGEIAQRYRDDPDFDIHDNVREVIRGLGNKELADVDRVIIKNFNHGILYFEGIDLLAVKTKMRRDLVVEMREAVRAATPDIQFLIKEVIRMGKCGEPIRTWGGRLYYPEPPAIAKKGPRKGELVEFIYKLFCYLIQGSAADATKEALIRYFETRRDSRLLNTIYDEINICAPERALEREDRILKAAMESLEFDVPMWTDRKLGPSWGELEKVK